VGTLSLSFHSVGRGLGQTRSTDVVVAIVSGAPALGLSQAEVIVDGGGVVLQETVVIVTTVTGYTAWGIYQSDCFLE
jgi:hypothetical protein